MPKDLTIVSVTYNHAAQLEVFINCLIAQTSDSWKLLLLHDGSIRDLDSQTRASAIRTKRIVEKYQREGFPIELIETEIRYNDWGHSLRAIGLEKVDTPYLNINNSDNYLVPLFVELMLGAVKEDNSDVSYCRLLHNYPNAAFTGEEGYNVLDTELAISRTDICNVVVRTDLAKKVGFNHRSFAADGLFIEDIKRAFPELKSKKVKRVLCVHN